jgi:homoserine O-acetyltransferase
MVDNVPMLKPRLALVAVAALCLALTTLTAQTPQPTTPPVTEGDFKRRAFKFVSGETLAEVKLHYRTLGHGPEGDAKGRVTNAVLDHARHGRDRGAVPVATTSLANCSGRASRSTRPRTSSSCRINIGHGKSSKPSERPAREVPEVRLRRHGHRAVPPRHRGAQGESPAPGDGHVDGRHAHVDVGPSAIPTFMDAADAARERLPTQISGRNRVWRRVLIDAIRTDPAWNNGNYTAQPPGLRVAAQMLWLMSSNPVRRQNEAPTLADADRVMENYVANYVKTADANDVMYYFEASRDYDPAPGLDKIIAPLVAINFADDIINPPELGILEREIARVKRGRAVTYPLSDRTAGHGTHTIAAVWKDELGRLLKESER